MQIKIASIYVDDQDKALRFYTEVLGFVLQHDVPAGEARWITVVSPEGPDDIELLLEPLGFAPARTYQQAVHDAGIPFTILYTHDVEQEYQRLKALGVVFTTPPTPADWGVYAVFDDTCGNLIMLQQG